MPPMSSSISGYLRQRKGGYAKEQLDHASGTMEPLIDAIINTFPTPRAMR